MAWTERFVDAAAVGGGTGTSAGDPWTLAEAVSNSAAGMRVNIKAGVYNVTSNTIVSANGTVYSPIWWRGYKTTVGDLDDKFTGNKTNGTDLPQIRSNGGYFMMTSDFLHITGIAFTSNMTSRPGLFDRRQYSWAKNCRFFNETTATIANAANDSAGDSLSYLSCEFGITDVSTASFSIHDSQTRTNYSHCVFYSETSGKSTGVDAELSSFDGCIFYNMQTGVVAGDFSVIKNCSFVDMSDDAIVFDHIGVKNGSMIVSNYFYNVTGYCLGNPSTASTSAQATLLIANNCYYNSPNKFENIGDAIEFDALSDSTDQFVDKASGDYTLSSSSAGYNAGLGGFWSIASTDFRDVGAVQHQDPSGGGGAVLHPLRSN